MPEIIEPASFGSFGPSLLADQTRGDPETLAIPASREEARQLIRIRCPSSAGVYGWLNADKELIYVGKSKSLRSRLLSYFAKHPSDPKMSRIREQACAIKWEPIIDELLALLREQELIHRWRPDYNSQGQPNRRQPAYICLSNSAAPHAFLARRLDAKYLNAFGPIAGFGDLAESIAGLNYVFRLRDCPDKTKFEFGDQLRLFSDSGRAACLRFELGSCPGPCAALCTKRAYQERLDQAVNFLKNGDAKIVDQLEQRMREAGRNRNFERAAMLRGQWESLSRLSRQLGRLRRAEQSINGVLNVLADRGRGVWLVFRNSQLVDSIVQPRSKQQATTAIQRMSYASTRTMQPASEILDINLQLIIAAWFRKNPQRLSELISFTEMGRVCYDIIARYSQKSA